MLINNKSLDNFSAELIDRKISTTNITSNLEWLNNISQCVLLSQYEDYKRIKLQFLIQGDNEENALKNISALTEELKQSVIKFDDINLLFECVLDGYFIPERQINGVFKIEYYLKNSNIKSSAPITLSHSITPLQSVKKVNIRYILNNGLVFGNYIDAFSNDDIYKPLNEIAFYFNKTTADALAETANGWDEFFLSIGLDLNKYKPIENNTYNGFVNVENEYTAENAKTFINNTQWDVYYTRFHKDGIPDLPTDVTYPNITISVGNNNDVRFNTGVGQDLNPRNYKLDMIGKFNNTDYHSGSSNYLFDTSVFTEYLYMINNNYYAYYRYNGVSYSHQLEGWSAKTANTLVNSTYGVLDKNALTGNKDLYFNSEVIAQNITPYYGAMPSNTYVLGTANSFATNFDLSRVKIYYNNELYCDLIPVVGNLKNGFINSYGIGLYDINKMKFLKPIRINEQSSNIPDILNIPTPATNYPEPM